MHLADEILQSRSTLEGERKHCRPLSALLGDIAEAVATAREGVDFAEAGEFPYWEAMAQIALAAALSARGEPLAHAEIESALARAEHDPQSCSTLARAQLAPHA